MSIWELWRYNINNVGNYLPGYPSIMHYEDGEPIFLDDIHIEGMKRDNFRQQIKTLADAGKIVRYEKGIYYIPKKTRFSSSAGPTPETVARYKYISRGGRTYTDYNIWEPKFKCISESQRFAYQYHMDPILVSGESCDQELTADRIRRLAVHT